MAKVTINNTSFTEVLDGAGFVWCDAADVVYEFGDTQPSVVVDETAKRNPRDQVNGFADKTLWAMLPSNGDFTEATVVSEAE